MELLRLPQALYRLAKACPFPLYVVGGVCRDTLAGFAGNRDYDLCAPVSADAFVACAQESGFLVRAVYANTGTVKLSEEGEEYEFACFRTDEYVRGHAPSSVQLTGDIVKDALRRDFTCNAIYYDIKAKVYVDPLGGIADVQKKIVRTVREANRVFGEDGLRLMRLCRLAAQTGFTPSADCLQGAKNNAFRIREIAPERIGAELDAILHADQKNGIVGAQYSGLKLLHATGVMAYILPELTLGEGMEQRADYHQYDVLEHSLRCVYYAPPSVRLAALLHDVAKPYCMKKAGNFHEHEQEGARISKEICERLRVSKAKTEEVCRLIALHMYDLSGQTRESKIRRIAVDNADIWDKLLALKQADFSACKDNLSQAPTVKKWKLIQNKMLAEGVPFTLKQLAVNGNDLIACGISPRQLGKILPALLYECALGQLKNKKERLINRALSLAQIR